MNAVDWTKIADHNITFGIVRFREFSTVAVQDDPRFREWWPAMRKAGLIRGAFLLLDPARNASRADLEREAQHFIDAIESVGGLEPGDLPLSVDYEQVGQNPPTGLPQPARMAPASARNLSADRHAAGGRQAHHLYGTKHLDQRHPGPRGRLRHQ
jgi:GH25 family lysozyme M1 (1,4-beta-N-acetylmuramidase)